MTKYFHIKLSEAERDLVVRALQREADYLAQWCDLTQDESTKEEAFARWEECNDLRLEIKTRENE